MMRLNVILQIMNQNAIPLINHCLKEIINKVTGLMKDELGSKIMAKFVGLRARSSNYLTDDCSEDKKVKCAKKCVMKKKTLKFENYKNCSEATQLKDKINYIEKK